MAQKKNTRLVYIDKKNLDAYERLKPEDFKEFFMAYFTYHTGDDMSKCFSNEYVYNLFSTNYQDKIDHNEAKWQKKADASKENGKKGGRPRKGETAEEARKRKEQEIEPNLDFENEVLEQHSNTPINPIFSAIETPQQNFYTTPPPELSQGLEDPPLMDFMGNQSFMRETYNSFINNNAI